MKRKRKVDALTVKTDWHQGEGKEGKGRAGKERRERKGRESKGKKRKIASQESSVIYHKHFMTSPAV